MQTNNFINKPLFILLPAGDSKSNHTSIQREQQ